MLKLSLTLQNGTVFTSVILAWHLSHFDDWTAWSLLGEILRHFI